ncbi:MAG: hypothetical protein EHM36_01910, partial [Deltaproteobacteria bacterium]
MGKPWEAILVFDESTWNSVLNGADIKDNELKTALHVLLDNKVLEKGAGLSLLTGCPIPGAEWIDGLWRSWNKDGDKKLLIATNGNIYYWTGS